MAVLSDLVNLGLARESTPGTVASPATGHFINWSAVAHELEGDFKLRNENALGTRFKTKLIKTGVENWKVSVEGSFDYYMGAVLLYALNTSLSTSDNDPETGTYTHTLTMADSINAYSLHLLGGPLGSIVFPYGVLDSLKVNIGQGFATVQADFFARKYQSTSGTASYETPERGFVNTEATITINSTSYIVKEANLEFSENAIIETGLGSETFDIGAKGQREEKIGLTVLATNNDLETLKRNNSLVPVEITLTDIANTIGTSTHPSIKFSWSSVNVVDVKPTYSLGEHVVYEVELEPVNNPVSITVVNDWDNTEMTK